MLQTRQRSLETALAEAIIRRIGAPRYQLWFERHTIFERDEAGLTVGVPNLHYQEWLQKTFSVAVTEAAAEVFGCALAVRFLIDPGLFQKARREQDEARKAVALATSSTTSETKDDKEGLSNPKDDLVAPLLNGKEKRPVAVSPATPKAKQTRRWRRLHDFVVGACNRVAHASAMGMVEDPLESPSPLVLHGPVGTGKTHLLEGIYVGLRRARPDWRITFVSTEDFTNRFVQAMRLGKLMGFRKQFRSCDALLLDDLHFLASKKATQEEFLHTFDTLIAEGKAVVVTCDCHPRLADDFTPGLADRLLGGAVWGLTPPDRDTRLALLRQKSLRAGVSPPCEEVLAFLADRLRGNVRELEGALNSICHYAQVTRRLIDLQLVREALSDLLRHAVRVVQLTDVERAVCGVLKLESTALRSKGRCWAVSHPRMVAIYLARKHTASSYGDVGSHFGGRNHSTAVAAEKKVRKWLDEDVELALGERRLRVRELVERAERDLLR